MPGSRPAFEFAEFSPDLRELGVLGGEVLILGGEPFHHPRLGGVAVPGGYAVDGAPDRDETTLHPVHGGDEGDERGGSPGGSTKRHTSVEDVHSLIQSTLNCDLVAAADAVLQVLPDQPCVSATGCTVSPAFR